MSVVSNGSSVKSSRCSSAKCCAVAIRLRGERVLRMHHDDELVLEQLVVHEAGVRLAPNADRDVERLLAQRAQRVADGRWNDAELDAGTALAKPLEDGREPVVRGVALGAQSQQLASPDRPPAISVRARSISRKHRTGGSEQPVARLGGDEPAGPSREQRNANALLERAETVAQRRLRDVERRRGARDGSLVGNGDEHAKLPGLEIHEAAGFEVGRAA